LSGVEEREKSETEHFRDQTQYRFNKQLFVITIFYVFASILDWVYLIFGPKQLQNGNIACLNEKFIVVVDNKGAILLLVYTVVTYSYAAVMFYVFYYVPKSSGLVVNLTLDGAEMTIEKMDLSCQNKSVINLE
jgi:hypothetical protein